MTWDDRTDRTLIGIDVGGTKTHAVAFDQAYYPLAEMRAATTSDGADALGSQVAEIVGHLSKRVDGRSVTAIGIGIPGLVDRKQGQVRAAVNLGIGEETLSLVDRVAEVSSAPCHIDNDVNVGALGARQLIDPSLDDLAYLSIGTGVAAGIIVGGHLHRGHIGVAGEIGHFPVMDDGPPCCCGLNGCLETVASGPAIARQWPADQGRTAARSLVDAAADGDDRAIVVLRRIGGHLAMAVYLLTITYDVSRIVIGGGVADLGHRLLRPILDGLARLEERSSLVRSLDLPARVSLKPDGPVAAVGAAVLAVEVPR